jgi:hypothetical protein
VVVALAAAPSGGHCSDHRGNVPEHIIERNLTGLQTFDAALCRSSSKVAGAIRPVADKIVCVRNSASRTDLRLQVRRQSLLDELVRSAIFSE